MAPRMSGTCTRIRHIPNVAFSPPPLPALHGVDLVCERPLEVCVKKSDAKTQFAIKTSTFKKSTLAPFLEGYAGQMNGLHVNAVGLNGNPVLLRLRIDDIFHNFTCQDHSWEEFCTLNDISEGDKVGVWFFTRHNILRPYMAVVITQKRVLRRTSIVL